MLEAIFSDPAEALAFALDQTDMGDPWYVIVRLSGDYQVADHGTAENANQEGCRVYDWRGDPAFLTEQTFTEVGL